MATARTPAPALLVHIPVNNGPGIMRESLTVGHGLLAVRSLIAFFLWLPNLIETSPRAQVHNGSRSKLYRNESRLLVQQFLFYIHYNLNAADCVT